MKALTIEEFEAICKYFYEFGQKNLPFDEVYKDFTNGKLTTKPLT